jgi:hypothetical protein
MRLYTQPSPPPDEVLGVSRVSIARVDSGQAHATRWQYCRGGEVGRGHVDGQRAAGIGLSPAGPEPAPDMDGSGRAGQRHLDRPTISRRPRGTLSIRTLGWSDGAIY